jgi:hypothetical protein
MQQDQRGWLMPVFVAVVAGVIAFGLLHAIRSDHTSGQRPVTREYADCMSGQLEDFIATGKRQDAGACQPAVPWYAERPLPYALIVGGVVLAVCLAVQAIRPPEQRR